MRGIMMGRGCDCYQGAKSSCQCRAPHRRSRTMISIRRRDASLASRKRYRSYCSTPGGLCSAAGRTAGNISGASRLTFFCTHERARPSTVFCEAASFARASASGGDDSDVLQRAAVADGLERLAAGGQATARSGDAARVGDEPMRVPCRGPMYAHAELPPMSVDDVAFIPVLDEPLRVPWPSERERRRSSGRGGANEECNEEVWQRRSAHRAGVPIASARPKAEGAGPNRPQAEQTRLGARRPAVEEGPQGRHAGLADRG